MSKQWQTRVGICFLTFSLLAFGQHPGTHRIDLDVVALDKSGQPIPGFTQQDFSLLDNKVPQTITAFQAVASTPPAVEVTLVIDEINTSFINVAHARQQVGVFLQKNDGKLPLPVSLVFLSDAGPSVPTKSSLDGKELMAAMNNDKNPQHTIRRSQGVYGAGDRLELSLRALSQLTDFEATRPGRKLMIWISPGWPLLSGPNIELSSKDQQQIFSTIVDLSTRLPKSGVTLYSVDPLGTSDTAGLRTTYYENFLKGVRKPSQSEYGNIALQVLAYQSGGRVLNSNNDVSGEIATCLTDANAYYVISYEGPAADGPNDYHSLDVKIDKPKITARTSSGYYAQP